MLASLPVSAQEQAARMADGYAHLNGFGEGVAAVLMSSPPAKRTRSVQGFNGMVVLKTWRQPGIELTTMSAGNGPWPASLTISRTGYPLPLGLHIGDKRGAVEDVLGAPATGGDTLVLKRTQGDGCDDPIVLSFRNKVLTQAAWTWESCMD
jgi:hypothetical protein